MATVSQRTPGSDLRLFRYLFVSLLGWSCGPRMEAYGQDDSTSSSPVAYTPCYPIPVVDDARGNEVSFSRCGDESVGNQSVWWRAVEPDEQCFGMSMPGRLCSRSTTDQFYCLAGPDWDTFRVEHGCPWRQRTNVVKLEVGNWLTVALAAATARIVLEEMMNYKVALVGRLGTFAAYERVARHQAYASLEVWEGDSYLLASEYYVWGDVIRKPFLETLDLQQVAWAATKAAIPDQPGSADLKSKTLAIEESNIQSFPLGLSGKLGMFVTSPVVERMNRDKLLIADYWRGHQQQRTLDIFPPDGTVKCVDRLKSGKDCHDPERTFFCPRECPNPLYGGGEASCCINGKFYPPQCIPEGVTYQDILADPEWASPNCREYLHVDMTWELSYHESIIVNLGLNYTVHYVGYDRAISLIRNRTLYDEPTIFAWWSPDPLVASVNAVEVMLPPINASAHQTLAVDPLRAEGRVRLPPVQLKKLVHRAAQEQEPDFYQFVQNFAWKDPDMDTLLRLHSGTGGELNVEEAACEWVKANRDTWIRWVSNDHAASQSGPESRLEQLVMYGAVAACACLLVALVAAQQAKHARSKHLYLKWEDIVFGDAPTVIGTGPMGDVLKGEYRGMAVAVKPVVPGRRKQVVQEPACSYDSAAKRVLSSDTVMLMDQLAVLKGVTRGLAERSHSCGDMRPGGNARFRRSSLDDCQRCFESSHCSITDLEAAVVGECRLDMEELLGMQQDASVFSANATATAGPRRLQRRWSMPVLSPSAIHGLQEINASTHTPVPTPVRPNRISWPRNRLRQRMRSKTEASSREPSAREVEMLLREEVTLLSKIRNPYLISFYGLTMAPRSRSKYIVTEFMRDSLHELIHNPTVVLDESLLLSMVKNVAAGMHYLHSMEPPVLHGTLRTVNVLVDSNLTAKVAEFGLTCKTMNDGRIFATAPEMLTGRARNLTAAQDVYSFGTLLYEVFMRVPPTESMDPHEWLANLEEDRYQPLTLTEARCCNATVRQLAVQCQALNPAERPTFAEVNAVLQQIADTSISQLMHGLQSKRRILDDILPPKIGEMLAQGKKVEPEHHECVTIFFSDIVGFTDISAKQPPAQVMEMLDRLYGKFDRLTKKHNLFKVETIGDAYMAVGNLHMPQGDHAVRVAMFAMDAIQAAKSTPVSEQKPDLGTIQIRVGFHTGPVVASVVGTTNPRYCLFGDTVNTASRMESTSEANCIHLSDKAADAMNSVKHSITILYRGYNDIKGKGEMHTFWIQGYHGESNIASVGGESSKRTLTSAFMEIPSFQRLRSRATWQGDSNKSPRSLDTFAVESNTSRATSD